MNAILILFLFGIVLLFCEVFVPGAILGSIGGIAMLAGCILAFHTYGAAGGALATLAALGLLGLTLLLEFVVIPRTRFGKKLFVQSTSGSTTQPPVAEPASIIGQTGEAATPLSPTGYVLVSGKRYEAFSRDGLLPKGAPIRVTGLDNFRLIVTKA
ncbi:MAG: serine protease [Opitutaceae bacterium]|jgi:membrane-bound ClpP family serine protease|nr:serine protease [Opitutaceae bacterium]